MTLKVTSEQEAALEKSLQASKPDLKNYDVLKYSCVTVCDKALQSQAVMKPPQPGPETIDRAGNVMQRGADKAITPRALADQAKEQNLITATQHTGQKVPFLRSLWGTFIETIERLAQ